MTFGETNAHAGRLCTPKAHLVKKEIICAVFNFSISCAKTVFVFFYASHPVEKPQAVRGCVAVWSHLSVSVSLCKQVPSQRSSASWSAASHPTSTYLTASCNTAAFSVCVCVCFCVDCFVWIVGFLESVQGRN